ncbi:MAG TPA: magnesium protoporphyrin IX methyltransferase [Prosthecochloris aestuarii]|jgi:magnesium-protoporphyrin O-methyltransferase|uniref:Magnesium protoporphyrin IX methyltransferase n=1 Tax=Prosthecochloris aestuarii TaxID=1102 RepID=A0A831SQX4_PROAE|nr:magnesium protoporphyrin IX methyltransferase [Prosthecochloris sp.]HED30229.1 magnesium protoporphyrin IX methyltransferase [Prosthecochloris aestuarii]
MSSTPSFNAKEHQNMLRSYFNGNGFSRWASIYGNDKLSTVRSTVRQGHAVMMDQAFAWLEQLRLPKGATILDAGCGTGLFSIRLAENGYRVKAVDIASQMVDKAREEASVKGVADAIDFEVNTIEEVQGTYDAVVCFDVLIHYPAEGFINAFRNLSGLTKNPVIFTYAPYNRILAFQHWLGGFFPKQERRTTIQMIRDEQMNEAMQVTGMQVKNRQKISFGFYHTMLMHTERK